MIVYTEAFGRSVIRNDYVFADSLPYVVSSVIGDRTSLYSL